MQYEKSPSTYQQLHYNYSQRQRAVYLLHVSAFFGHLNSKCTIVQALRLCTGRTAHRGNRGIALLFLDHGTRRRWRVSVTPRPLFTAGKTRYPLYRRLGGPQGQSGQVRKISPPPGFDPRTVQPAASRYIDYATRPTIFTVALKNTKICHWLLKELNKSVILCYKFWLQQFLRFN